MPIDVVTEGSPFPADALSISQDDGQGGVEGSVTWHDGPYSLSDVGETLTVDAGAGGLWPGVDGNVPAPAAESYEGNVYAVDRNPMGSLVARWRRISGGNNHQRLETIWATFSQGTFFASWATNPWWVHLERLGRWHAEPNDVNGIHHLMSSRWGPDTQYAAALSILRLFGVGVREGSAGLELIDLLAPETPYVDLAAHLIDGLPEEAEGSEPYNRAGGYLTRQIVVPYTDTTNQEHNEYRRPLDSSSAAPPLYVRSGRSYRTAVVEQELQRNQLRLSATRVTVKMACGWWGIEPGRGFRLPEALDPDRRVWRTESMAMEMSGRSLFTTLEGRLHQPAASPSFWTPAPE